MKKPLLTISLLLAGVPISTAGSGTATPGDGSYGFFEPDGPDEGTEPDQLGTGTFKTSGDPSQHQLTTNPNGGPSSEWKQLPDGKYHKNGNPVSSQTLCFYATGSPPYTFEYKLYGDVVSTGWIDY